MLPPDCEFHEVIRMFHPIGPMARWAGKPSTDWSTPGDMETALSADLHKQMTQGPPFEFRVFRDWQESVTWLGAPVKGLQRSEA